MKEPPHRLRPTGPPGTSRGGLLGAITCYFNPGGYRRKLRNYRIFRRRLTVPLVCVELSYASHFELEPSDADVLVQVRGQAVLWQKERLLNVALQSLPAAYEAVAWLDCDVIFERDDWPDLALQALQDCPLVHLFHWRCNLARTAVAESVDLSQIESQSVSLGCRVQTGRVRPDDVRRSDAPLVLGSTAGLAWATRRSVLSPYRLYDACILGTGDRAMVAAAMGKFDYGIEALLMNGRQIRHYLSWGRPFHAAVEGKIGYIEGRAYHLWHGDLQDRRYQERHEGLRRYDFDPSVDIAPDVSDCWRWNSNKPEMHAYVRNYFASRNEDGADAPAREAGRPGRTG